MINEYPAGQLAGYFSLKKWAMYYFLPIVYEIIKLYKHKFDLHKGDLVFVEGSQAYEVSFDFVDGEIRNLTCGCWCSYHCKHEYAVLLQFRDILEPIEENYSEQYEQSGSFAAISKSELLSYSLRGNGNGKITLF